jgi:outer membrane protein OmpA-like peptidoglycan-associated protein
MHLTAKKNILCVKYATLLLIMSFPFILHSQSKYQRGSIAFHLGTTQYQGELQNDFFRFRTTNPFNGLSYSHYASPLVDLKASLFMGSWGYEHEKQSSFNLDVLSLAMEAKVKLRKADDPRLMPYLFGGIGAQHYSNWTLTNSDGQQILSDTKGVPIASSEVEGYQSSASLGVGFQIRFAERVFLTLEERFVFPGIDIADGIEGKYADQMLMHTIGIGFGLFSWKDSDGDLIPDKHDKCPETPKIAAVDERGCPVDTDADGVPDYIDHCVYVPGSLNAHGCIDSDGDAVADSIDRCPGYAGLLIFEGCPDTDGDDVPDLDDECPSQFGLMALNGCPDDDNDGISNAKDNCAGTPADVKVDTRGCPFDADGDGVSDYQDKCPEYAGAEANQGCPEVKEEVKELFKKALTGIKFETGKDIIRPESNALLDSVVAVMQLNALYRLRISGYTDNAGDSLKNVELSDRRAKSVKNYLVQKGITEARILGAIGYGSAKPIADNSTKTGRAVNRRVEFEVEY